MLICNVNLLSRIYELDNNYSTILRSSQGLARVLYILYIVRVGKVSGIEVSGRVSGMPEMPGTKPRFWAPETARNCP